jgi:hypothetical protein
VALDRYGWTRFKVASVVGCATVVAIAPIIRTSPLNDEQREMAERYLRLREWCVVSARFDLKDDRVAGWISENS